MTDQDYAAIIAKNSERIDEIVSRAKLQHEWAAGVVNDVASIRDNLGKLRTEVGHAMHRMDNIEKPSAPECADLYKALVAAQLEIRNAEQNVENEFLSSRYADLASVMDAVREPLAKNGLVIIQVTATRAEVETVDKNPGAIGIKTILAHVSGQCIVDIIAMVPPKMDPQGTGSCRTYMRRYSVLAICAIAGAIDDDAEDTKTDPNDYECITPEEIDAILLLAEDLFKDKADFVIQQMVEKTFNVTHVSNIKAGETDLAITRLKNTARREKAAAKKGANAKPSPKPPAEKKEPEGKKDREPGEDDE